MYGIPKIHRALYQRGYSMYGEKKEVSERMYAKLLKKTSLAPNFSTCRKTNSDKFQRIHKYTYTIQKEQYKYKFNHTLQI